VSFTKKFIKRSTAAIISLSIASSLFTLYPGEKVSFTAMAATDANVQKLEEQIAALDKQQQQIQSQINSAQSEANSAASKKNYYDNLIYTTNQKITASESLIKELNAQIKASQAAIDETEKLIEQTHKNFLERMRIAHEDGDVSYIDMILGSQSITDFLSRIEQVNAMLEYDKTLKANYNAQKEDLINQKTRLEESKKLQEQTKAALEKDKKDNQKLAADAEKLQNDRLNAIKNDKAQLEKLKNEEARLDKQLEEALKKIEAQNSSSVIASGEYMRPVSGGWISCRYGETDPIGRPHYAYDIAIGYGTPIKATNSGTVVIAGWHYSYGYYVVLDHGNGMSSLYAHCSSLYVKEGTSVQKGQTIAAVGSTGFSTGNHLHFEIRKSGVKVNPANYVRF
jgi:murein DD-endopeptidase MepM/ murein hydrolase activator NlpD